MLTVHGAVGADWQDNHMTNSFDWALTGVINSIIELNLSGVRKHGARAKRAPEKATRHNNQPRIT